MSRQDANDAKTRMRVDELASAVVDAAIEVHRTLGPGFVESIYEEALAIELADRGVPFARQVPVTVSYKDRPVGRCFIDLIADGLLVVELKSASAILPVHVAQAISYLKATHLHLALLLNFDMRYMRDGIRRVVLTRH